MVKYTRRTHPLVFDRDQEGRWLLVDGLPEELEVLKGVDAQEGAPENEFFVTFHPSFTYEDFVEGMRPEGALEDESAVRYVVRPGIFKQACERAIQLTGFTAGLDAFCRLPADARRKHLADAPPVVLLIDEINRGNVARILGELITLIEQDKRLGAANELVVTLPGSRQRFGVPPNLWIVATMNTADRSVVALDTALRRRFSFREHAPRPELLDGVSVDNVNVRALLEAINARLLRLRDRDHLIGHAFFMPMKDHAEKCTLDELRRVFREAVVPLLCEYFYDDLGRVGLVLGPDFVTGNAEGGDIFAKGFTHGQREDLADRPTYHLADVSSLEADAFRRIYA
jgi:5-methylcytosine-specific restriction protein B